ncbi:hypothetical protein [Micromonospora echinaurantiaca]|uniref:hypothetical protein n=1 Tax=Micromonospora echinaurantiaca TaxID=47857 RepID=UPI0012FE332A|nr:hypothetical protein [Micromonospora echinaurantiaca]
MRIDVFQSPSRLGALTRRPSWASSVSRVLIAKAAELRRMAATGGNARRRQPWRTAGRHRRGKEAEH